MIQSGFLDIPRLTVRFYTETSGAEPVREWLKSLASERAAGNRHGYQNRSVRLADRDAGRRPYRAGHMGSAQPAVDAHCPCVVYTGRQFHDSVARVYQEGSEDTETGFDLARQRLKKLRSAS